MDLQFENRSYIESAAVRKECCFVASGVRLSVLSPYMIRVEEQISSIFCDQPTQAVVCRSFDAPSFAVEREAGDVTVKTTSVSLTYSFKKKKVRSITLENGQTVTDFHTGNLKGTRRTLDQTYGAVSLEEGIMSINGVAVLDDSASLLLSADGKILPRKVKETDRYYFAYGRKYKDALQDFYRLTGFPPLIPRFALGNWWSRYKAYTDREYKDLMQRFIDERIPICVATIDMDWHWVDVVSRFGKNVKGPLSKKNIKEIFFDVISPGWTGYSWNTDLFPDPEGFLAWLKSNHFKITMNLHPASGCRFYEDAYSDFARYMGLKPGSKEPIRFDITDEKFIRGYFRYLHHPQEAMGIDFWWIDWQQGKKTSVPGLDPLWALNHYHSRDIAREGKRPLIISRYAGAGSHRYPLGFSGDSAQNWASLAFQPYFTATASNIGYTWWSHDIGGHHAGRRDDELYLRWVQFGVFSPIMRLHSTSNEFMGKEPWKYETSVRRCAEDFLRFRHRLIPYLYSMNRRTAKDGQALCEPLYYHYADDPRAYDHPNEYFFGSELLVCPITEPVNKKTNLAGTKVFLPEGRYSDIFSDRIYEGDAETELFRDTCSIPVLAKEGAIIPLDCNEETNDCGNPRNMELLVYRGNSSFTLYEDDGETTSYQNGVYAETVFRVRENEDTIEFSICKPVGCCSVLPNERDYIISFKDVKDAEKITSEKNGIPFPVSDFKDPFCLRLRFNNITPDDDLHITLHFPTVRRSPNVRELKIEMISKMQGSNAGKTIYNQSVNVDTAPVPHCLKKPFEELKHLF